MLTRDVPLHLRTNRSDQSPLALCPGDPLRTRLVAREILEGAQQVTSARGLLGYTGRHRGVPVTVQTTGMGGGSAAIVVHELIELGARVLLRAGSCGGLQPDLALGELVVCERSLAADGAALGLVGAGARADADEPGLDERWMPAPDRALVEALHAAARQAGRPARGGTVVSTDLFYDPVPSRPERWSGAGCLAVEMEAAVLLALCARHGARGGCLTYVSNRLVGEPGWVGERDFRDLGLVVSEVALDALVRA